MRYKKGNVAAEISRAYQVNVWSIMIKLTIISSFAISQLLYLFNDLIVILIVRNNNFYVSVLFFKFIRRFLLANKIDQLEALDPRIYYY
jgi:hypothetical protein